VVTSPSKSDRSARFSGCWWFISTELWVIKERSVSYVPDPIKTEKITVTQDVIELTERLAENAHDVWAKQRINDGWKWGAKRDDAKKEHPCLVPYEMLPESEKQYDRNAAMETLKAIMALGYRIEKGTPPP
jgi:hypothetical protein